jgi:hypothetical protein
MKKQLIYDGRWKSQILYAGVRLGIFDCASSHVKSATLIYLNIEVEIQIMQVFSQAMSSYSSAQTS